jgi:energy-coupling factor transport system permease protein
VVGVTSTTNPVSLALIAVSACAVAAAEGRQNGGFGFYGVLAACVLVLRVAYRLVFALDDGGTPIFTLPTLSVAGPAGGLELFGTVTSTSVYSGFCDGAVLATMVLVIGAANAVADPVRLLTVLPAGLAAMSTAVVVALAALPQLARAVRRVRRAGRLRPQPASRRAAPGTGAGHRRGRTRRLGGVGFLARVAIPVLGDGLDRSMALAAAMRTRGYGAARPCRRGERAGVAAAGVAGMVLIAIGAFGVFGFGPRKAQAWAMLAVGVAFSVVAVHASGARLVRTRYRPPRWDACSVATAAGGLGAGATLAGAGLIVPAGVAPEGWPPLSGAALAATVLGLMPLFRSGQRNASSSGEDRGRRRVGQ